MKLSYRDRLYWVRFMTKYRQDNDVIDYTYVAYDKNKTQLQ